MNRVSRPWWTYVACAVLIFTLSSCKACKDDEDYIPPASESAPTTTMYMNYGVHNWYDTVTNRMDKCRYFDGVQNKAAQVTVRILVPDATKAGGARDLYHPQIFKRYPDFPSGDPNGMGVQVPVSGGYIMLISIFGEPDEDCCPGPPPGRPYFESIWPYDQTENGFRLRHVLPEFKYCIYF